MSANVQEILTFGGMVSVPAGATFTLTFVGLWYWEKELVHTMRKRKWFFPLVGALAASAAVSVFVGSKILPSMTKTG